MAPPDENPPQNASQACPLTPPPGEPVDPVVVAYLSDARAVEPGEDAE
jgi:hypothetical protein